ncbi:MAG: PepSY-like domain-containing protein [Lentimicrobiaceae bacterium]|nr:PepSY-like domain-containing protein [Lentimicrobiaceae bacterium]
MKNKILILLVAFIFVSFPACKSDSDNNNLEINRLPQTAQTFISNYFNLYTVNKVTKITEVNENGSIYECRLQKDETNSVTIASAIKIEFDANGNWTKIECLNDGKQLPTAFFELMPTGIQQYLEVNYPNIGINETEKKVFGYKIELLNDKELLFDKNGDILDDYLIGQGSTTGNGTATNTIENFVGTHFPDYTIVYIKSDYEDGQLCTKVYLRNGYQKSYKIVFDSNDNWREVEGDDDYNLAIPESILQLIPESISSYITTSYASTFVVEVQKTLFGYKIELANDVELYFDANGNLTGSNNGGNDGNIGFEELPETVKTFLNTYYSGVLCREIEKKNHPDSDGTLYEIELFNGAEIDFDANGNWLSVNGDDKVLPESFINTLPIGISTYITENYPTAYISEVEKKTASYKVEIIRNNNDIDLYFDLNGVFMYLDR